MKVQRLYCGYRVLLGNEIRFPNMSVFVRPWGFYLALPWMHIIFGPRFKTTGIRWHPGRNW